MRNIRRWVDRRRRVVWTEPKLPPYVKFNPNGVEPDPDDDGIQPGDISMKAITEEFLSEGDDAAPLTLGRPLASRSHQPQCDHQHHIGRDTAILEWRI